MKIQKKKCVIKEQFFGFKNTNCLLIKIIIPKWNKLKTINQVVV